MDVDVPAFAARLNGHRRLFDAHPISGHPLPHVVCRIIETNSSYRYRPQGAMP